MSAVPRSCVEMLYGLWIKMEEERKRRDREPAHSSCRPGASIWLLSGLLDSGPQTCRARLHLAASPLRL